MKKPLAILLGAILAVSSIVGVSAVETSSTQQVTPSASVMQEGQVETIEITEELLKSEDCPVKFVSADQATKVNEDGSFEIDLDKIIPMTFEELSKYIVKDTTDDVDEEMMVGEIIELTEELLKSEDCPIKFVSADQATKVNEDGSFEIDINTAKPLTYDELMELFANTAETVADTMVEANMF